MINRVSSLAALLCLLTATSAGAQSSARDGQPAAGAAEAEQADEAAAALPPDDPLSTTPVDEEVVVRGQLSRAALRAQIEMAQEAFYNRFNEINSSDEFDIHCRSVVELGSRIPRRRCEPNFWRSAHSEYARETVIALQGGSAAPEQAIARASYMNLELEKEMRELAATDPGLREALARIATLEEAYSTTARSRRK